MPKACPYVMALSLWRYRCGVIVVVLSLWCYRCGGVGGRKKLCRNVGDCGTEEIYFTN